MKVGVIQSCYVPWRGYFDFIQSVDMFVVYDDVQYSSGGWRNRNKVKTSDTVRWLTVPVKKRLGLAIDETEIEHAHPWQEQHRGLLKASLGKAPFFRDAVGLWETGISEHSRTISELNGRLLRLACEYLAITTPIIHSRPLNLTGAKTERLLELLGKLGATAYLSGPAARGYLDHERFASAGIRLEYKSYSYLPYPQIHPPFDGGVTVLDLIANTGSEARSYLACQTENEVAVP